MTISLYYGDEEYLLDQAVRRLRKQMLKPELGGLDYRLLNQPGLPEMLEAAETAYFNLGGRLLIEVHDFAPLEKAVSASADEKQLAELMEALGRMDGSRHIAFISGKVSKAVKFTKWLLSGKAVQVETHEFKQPAFWKVDEAVEMLCQCCRQRDIQIQREAAALMVQHLGMGLRLLMSEAEKLAVYTAGKPITPADVQKMANHIEDTFGMLNDWLDGVSRTEVFRTLDELLLRQQPIQLFALIQGRLGNIFRMRYWQQHGHTPQDIAHRLQKHPFTVKQDLQRYGRIPMTRLQSLCARTTEMEAQAKSGGLPARLALEILLSA